MAAEVFARLCPERFPLDVVAVGGPLDSATVLAAYRAGCFPWPSGDRRTAAQLRRQGREMVAADVVVDLGGDRALPWVSPDPRAVVDPAALHVPRSLRQRLRRCGWTCTLDADFPGVLAGCAGRRSTWITPAMAAAYTDLHAAGHAHSVEVWEGGRLVGGLYGVLTGGVFSGESMFHRSTDGSKVAVVDLSRRLREAGVVLLDTEEPSPHLAVMGQRLMARADYLRVLRRVRDLPVRLPTDARPAAALTSATA